MSSVSTRPTKADVVSTFRRTQILEAARASFAKHGLAAVTMDQIAKRARLAKGTVYLHYRSKEAILRDALRDGVGGLRDATVPGIGAAGSLADAVHGFFERTFAFFDAQKDLFYLMHAELEPRLREEMKSEMKAVQTAQTEAWLARLSAEKRRSTLPAADAARMIVSFAYGLSLQRLRGWSDLSVADDAATATTFVLKGMH